MFRYPRSDLSCDLSDGGAERGEAAEHGDTGLELGHLTVEIPWAQALAEQLDSVQLRFDASSAVIATPSSPDRPTDTP